MISGPEDRAPSKPKVPAIRERTGKAPRRNYAPASKTASGIGFGPPRGGGESVDELGEAFDLAGAPPENHAEPASPGIETKKTPNPATPNDDPDRATIDKPPAGHEQPTPAASDTRPPPAAPAVDTPDLLRATDGRSIRYQPLADYTWRGGQPYLSERLRTLIVDAVQRYALSDATEHLLTLEQLLKSILAENDPRQGATTALLLGWVKERGGKLRTPDRSMLGPAGELLVRDDKVILRWDVVEVLSEASRIRERLNPAYNAIHARFLLPALLRTRSGQIALDPIVDMPGGYPALRDAIVDGLAEQAFSDLADDARAWARILDELRRQPSLVPPDVVATRTAYAADRPQRVVDSAPGVAEDAAALADLILLEAAEPPLAIGLFGSWGSGKSTLIKELQHRIAETIDEEADRRRAHVADTNPETRLVERVVQIEFNA